MNEWGYSRDRSYKLIQRAYEALNADNKVEIDNARATQVHRIQTQMDDALERHDMKTYTRLLDMLNKIYSLYVEKQEVKVTNDVIKFKFDTD